MFNNKYLSLLIIVLITFSASAIGGVVTSIYKEPWYSQIIRPSFSPPASVFGPVWTSLYILMSLAVWINWINFRNTKTIKIYLFHIFFNSIWSIIFFWFSSNLSSFIKFIDNTIFYNLADEDIL